ncbi:hypothetical protein CDL15_Pgr013269 [Punica granatum]|uniref:Uncharacterized protein n=1 Tax=Punica granatum TaxID=22663 RepID=A0A218WNK3_PUNGR|nr:hypothetical protein CDL15_Pgr013269 [Punica granatum]
MQSRVLPCCRHRIRQGSDHGLSRQKRPWVEDATVLTKWDLTRLRPWPEWAEKAMGGGSKKPKSDGRSKTSTCH